MGISRFDRILPQPEAREMKAIERKRVLGVPIDIIDMPGALEYVDNLIQNDKRGNCIWAINSLKVLELQKEQSLKDLFENATVLLPDGIGVVLAIRLLHKLKIKRVTGVDLMQNICQKAAQKGYKIYIFGAKKKVNKKAVEKLKLIYPGIRIVGRCNGYLNEDKMEDLINRINISEPDILFVALGSPRQERWCHKYASSLNVKIIQGIGGALDAIVDTTKRAPGFIQKIGLEWLYRLIREPGRIRSQIYLSIFVIKVLKAKTVQMIKNRL